MQDWTKETMRRSAAMKQVSMNIHDDLWFVILTGGHQISYLAMIFLPANYLSVSCPFHQPPSMTHGYVDRVCLE